MHAAPQQNVHRRGSMRALFSLMEQKIPRSARKGTHAAVAAFVHYLAGKKLLIDQENVNFWASQTGNFKNLRMLPRQHVQKNHIIDGPACTYILQFYSCDFLLKALCIKLVCHQIMIRSCFFKGCMIFLKKSSVNSCGNICFGKRVIRDNN